MSGGNEARDEGQLPTSFTVDGVRFGEGTFERTVDRFSAAVLTADAAAIRHHLPTPTLQPLQISPHRALVFVYSATVAWRMGKPATVPHPDVRPREITDRTWVYGRRDGSVIGFPNVDSGMVRRRFGRDAARHRLGDHPAAAGLEALDLSRTPPFADIWSAGRSRPGPVDVIGPAAHTVATFEGTDDAAARLVVSCGPRATVEIDQGLAGLPFDPRGTFAVDPLPSSEAQRTERHRRSTRPTRVWVRATARGRLLDRLCDGAG